MVERLSQLSVGKTTSSGPKPFGYFAAKSSSQWATASAIFSSRHRRTSQLSTSKTTLRAGIFSGSIFFQRAALVKRATESEWFTRPITLSGVKSARMGTMTVSYVLTAR